MRVRRETGTVRLTIFLLRRDAAGTLVFAAVIGDAALIAEVIDVDAQGRDSRAVPGAPAPPRMGAAAFSSSLPPTQREIEGVGGEMWYEARHFGAGRAA